MFYATLRGSRLWRRATSDVSMIGDPRRRWRSKASVKSRAEPAGSGVSIIRSTAWLTLAQGTSLVFGLVVWGYAARVLSTEGFAQSQVGNAIGTYLAIAAGGGLSTLALAEYGFQTDKYRYLIEIQHIRRVLTAGVLVLLGIVVLVSGFSAGAVATAACAGVVVARQLWPEWADVAIGASARVTVARALYFVCLAAVVLLAVRRPGDAGLFGLVSLGTSLGTSAVWWTRTRRDALSRTGSLAVVAAAGVRRRPRPAAWAQPLKRSMPFAAGNVCGQALANADVVMLSALADVRSVALYGGAYRIVLAVQGVGVALRQASLGALSGAGASWEDALRFRARLLNATVALSSIAAGTAASLSGLAVTLAYGHEFAAAGPLLAMLVWSWPADFGGALVLNYLIVDGRRAAYLTAIAVAAVLNLSLNVLAIHLWGARGAAIVTLVSLLALLGMAVVAASRSKSGRQALRPADLGGWNCMPVVAGVTGAGSAIAGSFGLNELGRIGTLFAIALSVVSIARIWRPTIATALRHRTVEETGEHEPTS